MNTGRNLKYKWTLRDSIDLAINYNTFPDTLEDRIELHNAICKEIDYNTGNIQYGLSDGENSIFVGNDGGTYNVSFEGPSMDIDKINQSYKSFKNPKEAVKYAGELAKANREGLEQKQESTKLTSMFKR